MDSSILRLAQSQACCQENCRLVRRKIKDHEKAGVIQMRKKITRKEAITLCRDMWRWLEQHPKESRIHWPLIGQKYTNQEENETVPYLSCYACEYVKQRVGFDLECKLCPLSGLWGKEQFACLNSHYREWSSSTVLRHRSSAAKAIADWCDNWLKEHVK
jgi:hypothetical protein